LGAVYQAGTLSGNPLAMRAGIEMLKLIEAGGVYDSLAKRGERLSKGLEGAVRKSRMNARVQAVGSLITLFFAREPVGNFSSAARCDTARFAAFFRAMLERGVLLPPSQFEALFVSTAHTEADIDATISAAREALQEGAASAA